MYLVLVHLSHMVQRVNICICTDTAAEKAQCNSSPTPIGRDAGCHVDLMIMGSSVCLFPSTSLAPTENAQWEETDINCMAMCCLSKPSFSNLVVLLVQPLWPTCWLRGPLFSLNEDGII